MNQKSLLDLLSEARAEIEGKYLEGYRREFGDTTRLQILIHDSVLCRSFELETMIEFQEYEMIDHFNLDYFVELNICRIHRDEEQRVLTHNTFRIVTYPGTGCHLICPNFHMDIDKYPTTTKLAEFICKMLGSPVIWLFGSYNLNEIKAFTENGYTKLASLDDYRKGVINIHFQKTL